MNEVMCIFMALISILLMCALIMAVLVLCVQIFLGIKHLVLGDKWVRKRQSKVIVDPLRSMEEKLSIALKNEDYKKAAILRDRIASYKRQSNR